MLMGWFRWVPCAKNRAVGDSVTPLLFLGVSGVGKIGLDLLFVIPLQMGVMGAALATVLAQYAAGVGLALRTWQTYPDLRVRPEDRRWDRGILRQLGSLSFFTCLQQSVMNFGILMVQGLVNSFGPVVMAAFAAAVKIDTFAYLPVQDFGNAYSTFIAQNYGAGNQERIRRGTKEAFLISTVFSLVISALVFVFARPLMGIFIEDSETAVIACGVRYLRIEGAFYCGIGCLFLLYGYYRAVKQAGMSVVLTVISLGTRVVLAYLLSAFIGETGIWMAIPIGWGLADVTGLWVMHRQEKS